MSKHKPSLMLGTWRMAHLTIFFTFYLQLYHGCWICEALIRLFLWKRPSRWTLSSAVTFAAVPLWFIDTIHFNVRQSLSLSFWPLFLLAHDVLPWSVYVVITCKLLLWIHPIKWPFWLQILQLNAHQQSVFFENLISLPFCTTFWYLIYICQWQ